MSKYNFFCLTQDRQNPKTKNPLQSNGPGSKPGIGVKGFLKPRQCVQNRY